MVPAGIRCRRDEGLEVHALRERMDIKRHWLLLATILLYSTNEATQQTFLETSDT